MVKGRIAKKVSKTITEIIKKRPKPSKKSQPGTNTRRTKVSPRKNDQVLAKFQTEQQQKKIVADKKSLLKKKEQVKSDLRYVAGEVDKSKVAKGSSGKTIGGKRWSLKPTKREQQLADETKLTNYYHENPDGSVSMGAKVIAPAGAVGGLGGAGLLVQSAYAEPGSAGRASDPMSGVMAVGQDFFTGVTNVGSDYASIVTGDETKMSMNKLFEGGIEQLGMYGWDRPAFEEHSKAGTLPFDTALGEAAKKPVATHVGEVLTEAGIWAGTMGTGIAAPAQRCMRLSSSWAPAKSATGRYSCVPPHPEPHAPERLCHHHRTLQARMK